MTYSASDVICDWLDVTYAPDAFPGHDVGLYLQSLGCEALSGSTERKTVFRVGEGIITVEQRPRWGRISASGAALGYLRTLDAFELYLSCLAEESHTITRLDAAYDQPIDGADSVARLRAQYPQQCAIGRKAQGVRSYLKPRADGRETGTFYVGDRRNGDATARVYDKAQQLLEVQGIETGPTTRTEITVKKWYGATLRDAARPESIFWHFAAPALLARPDGVSDWQAGWGEGWEWTAPSVVPAAALKRRVDNSADIAALVTLADAVGLYGREMLLDLLARRIKAA